MEKRSLSLREKQLEYLRILKELDRFCAENNLVYYMGCGTLIGAVRHKVFIPWDDDLDVIMPRPDFLRLCSEYHSDNFNFRNIRNDKSHPYNFGRLCSNEVYRLYRDQKVFNVGIDIYVINGAPSSREEQIQLIKDTFVHIKRASFLLRIRNGLIRRKLWPFRSRNLHFIRRELFRAEQCFERYDYDTSSFIWPFGGGRLIMPKSNYGTPVRIEFEDGFFLAPEHYHEVLTLGYGDYMALPPEDKRKPYHNGIVFR